MSRELDIAITKALGNQVKLDLKGRLLAWNDKSDNDWIVLRYSTDANDMLELDREMRQRGFEICNIECIVLPFINKNKWKVAYRKPDHIDYDIFQAEANTEPLARALAAHIALTGVAWDENNVKPDYTKFMNECLTGMNKIKDF